MSHNPRYLRIRLDNDLQHSDLALKAAIARVLDALGYIERQEDGPMTMTAALKDIQDALAEVKFYQGDVKRNVNSTFELNEELAANQELAEDAYHRGKRERLDEIMKLMTPENQVVLLRIIRLNEGRPEVDSQENLGNKSSSD